MRFLRSVFLPAYITEDGRGLQVTASQLHDMYACDEGLRWFEEQAGGWHALTWMDMSQVPKKMPYTCVRFMHHLMRKSVAIQYRQTLDVKTEKMQRRLLKLDKEFGTELSKSDTTWEMMAAKYLYEFLCEVDRGAYRVVRKGKKNAKKA